MNKMRDHSAALVEQAVLVSQELIRVAILWHELWHEGLEEASRLFYGDHNIDAMFATLEPLHDMLEKVRTSRLRQSSFVRFLADLHSFLRVPKPFARSPLRKLSVATSPTRENPVVATGSTGRSKISITLGICTTKSVFCLTTAAAGTVVDWTFQNLRRSSAKSTRICRLSRCSSCSTSHQSCSTRKTWTWPYPVSISTIRSIAYISFTHTFLQVPTKPASASFGLPASAQTSKSLPRNNGRESFVFAAAMASSTTSCSRVGCSFFGRAAGNNG